MRLPFTERMQFNRMVRSGFKGRALIEWLAEHGVPGVNGPNLYKYKRSPDFRAWLDEEKQVDVDREGSERAMRLAAAIGGSASEKLKSILAGSLFKLMPNAGAEDTAKLVAAVRAVTEAERLELQRRQVGQRDEVIALENRKFNRRSVELFVEWDADKKAREILDSPDGSADEKTELLGKHIFGEDWQ